MTNRVRPRRSAASPPSSKCPQRLRLWCGMVSDIRFERAAFLGVERSLTGRRWPRRLADDRLALAIAQRHGLPDAISRLLAARDVDLDVGAGLSRTDPAQVSPDPSHLCATWIAAERLVRLFGRASASSCSVTMTSMARPPQRCCCASSAASAARSTSTSRPPQEGYGPNAPALLGLKAAGTSVVVTGRLRRDRVRADRRGSPCRARHDRHRSSHGRAGAARSRGVVDPNRLDDDSPHKQLAAVGVAFLLAVGVNRALRGGLVRGRRRRELARASPTSGNGSTSLRWGTVCDVVPLTGINRALVRQGSPSWRSAAMPDWQRPDMARLKEPPGAHHLGFMLGPRVNAGGRVGEAAFGARLLSSDDPQVAALAMKLDEFNAERRAIERDVLDQAIARIEGLYDPTAEFCRQSWSSEKARAGTSASSASSPAVCRTLRPSGLCDRAVQRRGNRTGRQGLRRSVRGVDLGAAVIAARQSGLLLNGAVTPWRRA